MIPQNKSGLVEQLKPFTNALDKLFLDFKDSGLITDQDFQESEKEVNKILDDSTKLAVGFGFEYFKEKIKANSDKILLVAGFGFIILFTSMDIKKRG